MNTWARTTNNKKRLSLKSFFKIPLTIFKNVNIENLNDENSKLNGVIGSGGSRFGGRKVGYLKNYTYEVKYYNPKKQRPYLKNVRFKKQQLIGKIYYEFGCQCKIIRALGKRERGYLW